MLAAGTAAVALTTACVSVPPSLPFGQPRQGIHPRSYKMKLAVLNFVDQTRSAGKLMQTMPDILATELFDTGRFEVMERAELRGMDPTEIKQVREAYRTKVDAFLVGSITKFSTEDRKMAVDVHVINAEEGTVMHAAHHDVRYEGVLDVKVERRDVRAISQDIQRAFPDLSGPHVKIIGISGRTVTVSAGQQLGVHIGMGVLIAARGDRIQDPSTGEDLGDEIFVAEAYIVEVAEKRSKALLATSAGQNVMIRLGDKVKFK